MKKIMFNDKFGLTQAVLEGRKTMTRRIIKCPRTFRGEWVAGFNIHRRWTNKMFVKADLMPRHIEFTDRKVERLQDISDEDCLKEGIYEDSGDDEFPPSIFYEFEGNKDNGFDTPREAFAALIDKVSGKGTWESNPYVWAYEFELMK